MRSPAVCREVVYRALTVHVLDPEDVRDLGGGAGEPTAVLSELEARGRILPAVSAALERYVARFQAEAAAETRSPRPTGSPDLAALRLLGGGGTERKTYAPEANPLSAAVDLGGANPERKTYAPEASAASEASPSSAALVLGGASPERRTYAPEAADVPERPTVAPAGDAPALPRTGSGPGGLLVDLSALEPDDRRAICESQFARIVLRRGLATREQIAAARAGTEGRFEDRLVAAQVVDPVAAIELFSECQTARPVCRGCFELLESERAPCVHCGRGDSDTGSDVSRGTGTVVGSESRRAEIAGFPGEAGRFGGYEILERVAEGGMGVVFKARQTGLNRIVALKVMRGGSLASRSRRRRFVQEAEAAAALEHPSIVAVHDVGEILGYPFYTMDFVDGPAIDRHVADRKPTPRQVAALVRAVAGGVQHFHLHGIIHRDLKPENILVAPDGAPRIIDFGIAKKLGREVEHGTVEGDVLGTPHYMAPEQAAGRVREVDARSDVYSLGTILYELLAGAPPFSELEHAELLVAIARDDPAPLRAKRPELEPDLELIVQKAMAKERERRYQSAAELAQDLERFERNLPITARRATLVYRARKMLRRRFPEIVATAAVLAIAAGFGAWTLAGRLERQRRVAELLAEAQDRARAELAREDLLSRVLALEPENLAAASQLTLLRSLREERVRSEQKRVQDELARERAERAAKEAEAREQARLEAEGSARREGERRAAALLEKARGEKDPLAAAADLADALALLPPGPGELRKRIEERKLDGALALAREAVAANQTGLAEFWLRGARALESAGARAAEIDAIERDLARLASGERDLEEARALARSGQWVAARARLEQVRAQGLAPALFEKDLELARARCSEAAAALAGDGESALARGDAATGLARALEALRADPASAPARALASACEARIARDARAEAAALSARPETRPRALAVLEHAAQTVSDPSLAASLRLERAARARLALDPALAGLVFVPDVPELAVRACYLERVEVTNARFKRFVDEGGYSREDLWDEEGRRRLPTFRDGCEGSACSHRGPRSWTSGGYGDAANAERPVAGVTAHEARAFARWLSRTAGGSWRLPTEREWEVAAGWDPQLARLRDYPWAGELEAGGIAHDADLPRLVGATPGDVSSLGLADAGGNVLEWVERAGQLPGTKGADFASSEAFARRFAFVRRTGTPEADPPPELLRRVGFRLVREIGEDAR